MQPIKAVLFDFGMVLTGPPVPAVWAEMQRVSGLDDATLHRLYWAHRDDYDRGTLDGDPFWRQVGEDAGRPLQPERREQLMALDVELWTDMNLPMLAWVAALHRARVKTGILSNMGDAMAEGIRRKFDWIGNFHHIVWSHTLRLRKPEQAIYAAAAQGLNEPPGQILFIDDKQENIQAAQQFGMRAMLFRDYESFVADVQSCGFGNLLHPGSADISA